MTTALILQEIQKLPVPQRLLVVEKTLKSIREESKRKLEQAADALREEYFSNPELTSFTQLDTIGFYETRGDMVD